ncbi:hypothetical protein BJ741DRAFT_688797 [Chytriomyces cf. hyalinus JEL632]|nr:hypothetical protein BJ741DRAFT_688797 [Chytriomyces cf. hyalinus JEL632]
MAHTNVPASPFVAIPDGGATVHVRVMINGKFKANPRLFVRDEGADASELLGGTAEETEVEKTEYPALCFLIEKEKDDGSMERIMFDLGLRKDPTQYSKLTNDTVVPYFTPCGDCNDVAENLALGNLTPSDIHCVILSHDHFDHCGDPLLFPESTRFELGDFGTDDESLRQIECLDPPRTSAVSCQDNISLSPSTNSIALPTAAARALKHCHCESTVSLVLEESMELRSASKAQSFIFPQYLSWRRLLKDKLVIWQSLGAFDRAFDYFGDGSFWILDAPGHCQGHIMAMARTTAFPCTYILFASDAAHAKCLYSPVNNPATRQPQRRSFGVYADGYACDARLPRPNTVHEDVPVAYQTVERLTRMDALDNVFVIAAHETEIEKVVDMIPLYANEWYEKGWKVKTKEAMRKVENSL